MHSRIPLWKKHISSDFVRLFVINIFLEDVVVYMSDLIVCVCVSYWSEVHFIHHVALL
jgi:hypothetical protein